MLLYPIDTEQQLFISPAIDDWTVVEQAGIDVIFDMDGGIDPGTPTVPDHIFYVYFPIYDEELPDLKKLQALGELGASLIRQKKKVLSHCQMGYNRSALVAAYILNRLGHSGPEAVSLIRSRRPGALFNEIFARHLESLS